MVDDGRLILLNVYVVMQLRANLLDQTRSSGSSKMVSVPISFYHWGALRTNEILETLRRSDKLKLNNPIGLMYISKLLFTLEYIGQSIYCMQRQRTSCITNQPPFPFPPPSDIA